MQTELAKQLGIEFPIFAFTHCRDVVVAVSKAGGLGVLGAVGFTPEQLEVELAWIDQHIGDKPYGVDIVIPGKYEGMGVDDAAKLEADLKAMIPQEHRDFVEKLLADHGVPEVPSDERMQELLGWTEATARPQVDCALAHPKVKLIANALGTPPAEIIEEIHATGRLVAALCGAAKQAKAHQAAGVDIIIAQGTEGGGHTGDVASTVLWPEVIDAVAPTPVLVAASARLALRLNADVPAPVLGNASARLAAGTNEVVPVPVEDSDPVAYDRIEQEKRAAAQERSLALLGRVNPLALEEYAALEERSAFLTTQLEDLTATRRDLLTVIKEVDDRIDEVFRSAYEDTAREFVHVFAALFPGGEGRLVLTEPDDMLATGIEVMARPAGKKVSRLSLLSGGERSLTAIAFLVALFRARPSPFYVLDEVEAALDDRNLGRLLELLEGLRDASQLIVITHQKRTMEIADALYGVTMRGDGVSAVVSQRLREREPA